MRLLLFFVTALIATAQSAATDQPVTQTERLEWSTLATVGARNLVAGAFTAAFLTAKNRPPEYGPHWSGYGKRQALRLSGAATSNLMEAELGALWGEDPRYRHSTAILPQSRLWHAIKTSFQAYDRNGNPMPAYARFIAVPTSNVLANTWRPDSQHTARNTGVRIGLGFVSRMAANTFTEFWPDLRQSIFLK